MPRKAWPDISHLPPGHRDEITQILDRYPCLFSGKLGCFQGVTHDIDVQGAAPVIQPYYRMSPEKKQILKTELDKMLELGIIRPSRSQWASHIILVRKSDSEWRPCIDYRKINDLTRGEAFPIPRLDDLVDQVAGSSLITIIDLNRGYWQIPLAPRASEIAAFITPWGLFEPLTLPFNDCDVYR